MYAQVEKPKANKSRAVANSVAQIETSKNHCFERQEPQLGKKTGTATTKHIQPNYQRTGKPCTTLKNAIETTGTETQLFHSKRPPQQCQQHTRRTNNNRRQPNTVQPKFDRGALRQFEGAFPTYTLMKNNKDVTVRGPVNNVPKWEAATASYRTSFEKQKNKRSFIGEASKAAADVGNYIKKHMDGGGSTDTGDKITVTYTAKCGNGPCSLTYQFGGQFGDGYVIEMIGFSTDAYIASGLRQDRNGEPSPWEKVYAGDSVPKDIKKLTSYNATHETDKGEYNLNNHDDITKMAGESARWIAVREAMLASQLNDNTFFYYCEKNERNAGECVGISFADLWKQWQVFKKNGEYFNINNAALRRCIQLNRLKNTKRYVKGEIPKTSWKIT